jgi:hypothetical protein
VCFGRGRVDTGCRKSVLTAESDSGRVDIGFCAASGESTIRIGTRRRFGFLLGNVELATDVFCFLD